MARVTTNPIVAVRAGVQEVLGAVDAGLQHAILNKKGTSRKVLVVKNAAASPITVSIQVAAKVDGLSVTARTVSVPASQTFIIGPFTDEYVQADDKVYFDFSTATSVTFAVIEI